MRSESTTSYRKDTGRLSMHRKPSSSRTFVAIDLPEPEMPVIRTTRMNAPGSCRSDTILLDHLALARDELAGGTESAQLKDRAPHRRLRQDPEGAPGGHRNHHLAHLHAQHVLRQC